jgi:hypothetical protein
MKGGIVAENKNTLFSVGENFKISSISSLNHTLSISSASSKTKYFISSKTSLFLFRWSITLPGVQTTI